MAFFLAIIVFPVTSIVLFLLINLNGIGVISSCWGNIFSVLLFLKIFFFFIYTRGFSKLSKYGIKQSRCLLLSRLCLFGFELFGTRFFGNGVFGSISLR